MNKSKEYRKMLRIANEMMKKVKNENKLAEKETKLHLNIKSKINKMRNKPIINMKLLISKIDRWFKSPKGEDLISVCKSVIGYGILIWLGLYTFFGFKFNILFIFGAGASWYVICDFIDYCVKTLRGNKQ